VVTRVLPDARIQLVDHDPEFTEFAATHLAHWNGGVLRNPAVTVLAEDASAFSRKVGGGSFDVILLDLTAPHASADRTPWGKDNVERLRDALTADGTAVLLCDNLDVASDFNRELLDVLTDVFGGAHFFVVPHTGSCLATVTSQPARAVDIADAVVARFGGVLETLTREALGAATAMGAWRARTPPA